MFGSYQADELKSHSHTIPVGISMAAYTAQNQCLLGGNSTTTSLTGGTETRPKNIALLYCIKY